MENLDHINKKDDEMRHILQGPLEGDAAWAQPGEQVWEGIEASLPPQKRRGFFWWWLGGLTVLALILLISQQLYSDPENEKDKRASLSPGDPATTEQIVSERPMDAPHANPQGTVQNNPGITSSQIQSGTLNSGLEKSVNSQVDKTQKREQEDPILAPSSGIRSHSEKEKEIIFPIQDNSAEEELRADLSAPDVNSKVQLFAALKLPFLEVQSSGLEDEIVLERWASIPDTILSRDKDLKQNSHRLLVYGQGPGADRQIKRKSKINLFDPEFGHQNWQYRIGAGYEWQHKSGFFAGSGLEYQDFHEQVVKEKSWTYTKKNATQIGTDVYQQNIPLVINSGFGTTTTTLRVDIEENSQPTDYQEGESVSFRLTVDHSLKWLRVPLYAGYHYDWGKWFAEIRAGAGMQVFLASKSGITEILDARGKIKIRESESSKQINHLRSTIWDAQGGVYAGYRFSGRWSASIGYEQWYSLQSVVDRPNVSTRTNGSGAQVALRRTF